MMQGIGCDIVKIERLKKRVFSKAFLMRIFTASEIQLLPHAVVQAMQENSAGYDVPDTTIHRAGEQLAGMFSAKEAYKKAIGAKYTQTIYIKDIIIERSNTGAPRLRLERSAVKALRACSANHALVSISHEKEYAIAMVVIGC